MPNWGRVESLRRQGVDWETIAEDPQVGFKPPQGVKSSGRALRAYYRRKAPRRCETKGGEHQSQRPSTGAASRRLSRRELLAVLGLCFLAAAGIWVLAAAISPLVAEAPPGSWGVALLGALGGFMLVAGLVRGITPLKSVWKKGLTLGVVLGLVVSGASAAYEFKEGPPVLSSQCSEAPPAGGGWCHASNGVWTSSGYPVVFVLSSAACPYCASSSWALVGALSAFGTFTNIQSDYSMSDDLYPHTPELNLAGASFQSTYLDLQVAEGDSDSQIAVPSLTVHQNALETTYDLGGGIPFFTVGDIFIHSTSLVDPSAFHPQGNRTYGMSYATAESEMQNPGSALFGAVEPALLWFEAYLAAIIYEVGGTPPTEVTSNPTVATEISEIHSVL